MALRCKQTNKRKRAGRRERLRAGVEGLGGGFRRLSPSTIHVHGGARARVCFWAGAPRGAAQRQKRSWAYEQGEIVLRGRKVSGRMKAVYKLYLHLLRALSLAPSDALWRPHVPRSPQTESDFHIWLHFTALLSVAAPLPSTRGDTYMKAAEDVSVFWR